MYPGNEDPGGAHVCGTACVPLALGHTDALLLKLHKRTLIANMYCILYVFCYLIHAVTL